MASDGTTFVAISNEQSGNPTNGLISSTDGTNWTSSGLPISAYWSDIIFGDRFLVISGFSPDGGVNSNAVAISDNGSGWSTLGVMPASRLWKSVAYGQRTYVAIAYNSSTAATSPDGMNWTQRTLPGTRLWSKLTFSNGIFLAVSLDGFAAWSNDKGATWNSVTMPTALTTLWRGVIGDGKNFYAVLDNNGSNNSTNGMLVKSSSIPAASNRYTLYTAAHPSKLIFSYLNTAPIYNTMADTIEMPNIDATSTTVNREIFLGAGKTLSTSDPYASYQFTAIEEF
jgi:hypothetical protein